jgi:hypothetical protein
MGRSTDGFRRSSRNEKAGNAGIDKTPPPQGIAAHGTVAAGRALDRHKIAQSFKKEKLLRRKPSIRTAQVALAGFGIQTFSIP